MTLTQFAKLMATNPEDLFGLENNGRIAMGQYTNLVMIKSDLSYVLTAGDLECSNSGMIMI
ncbi:hypothetical protein LRP52_24695 [Photobacterium sp. ZSDE20]|uniref:Amidohydrolase-related domain-containing protein n=1 Tax=Photobacterium pectinilyticum TaxID=2906793 RepID=A0ABT1N601_9GAMM|nr:hypothetical protein [Photobacterium sp. ZSDE20]MCQ1059532.1 hypothetical protein [Photobacterium sp. ZSDE20]MDD1825395.1 hypothetical protein [Photobacterium sp. ZSDE20]